MTPSKLNIKQLFTIFAVAVTSPIIRSYGIYLADIGAESSWVGPIIGVIPTIILIFIIRELYKKNPGKKMEEIVYNVFGRFFGNIILIIILIWAMLVLILNTRILRIKICIINIYFITYRIFYSYIFRIMFYNFKRKTTIFCKINRNIINNRNNNFDFSWYFSRTAN